jgi:hypothetical protein
MPPRIRKAFGLVVLLAGLLLYAALAATLGGLLPEHEAARVPYYLAAGLLWIWPALRLIRWMQARDR